MAQLFFGYNLAVLVVGVVVPFCVFGTCYVWLGVFLSSVKAQGADVKAHAARCQLLDRAVAWYYASYTISAANCCLDPLLYCFSSPRFREALRGTLANARKPNLIRSFCQQSAKSEESPDIPNSTMTTSDRAL
ncbi:hypothetical protein SKAU_G00005160 [Synaphobranchus kaupii]|uniref:G-protein coupled receptors family 1 profile domain-containing protein n=1 Tax=Synaphobranchus kaupii TaxID=118154 RepID=A0A9Q1JBL6_SYNKA|nr:hypothetical protein SKAU_G00005160 [Synaphobranchus kaupii]